MSDDKPAARLLAKYGGTQPNNPYASQVSECAPLVPADDVALTESDYEEHDSWSLLRMGRGQEVSLDLRLKTGDCLGLSYAYLVAVQFDPSGRILLWFTSHHVTIEGRGLKPLYDALLRHRVRFVQEEAARLEFLTEGQSFVSKIVWRFGEE